MDGGLYKEYIYIFIELFCKILLRLNPFIFGYLIKIYPIMRQRLRLKIVEFVLTLNLLGDIIHLGKIFANKIASVRRINCYWHLAIYCGNRI